ncbi:hypothetical protein MPTK1_6g19870 [Marchantia polymorpha subsp. ruderalis]|uniref:Uncharacterized protein n=2 Tax=Marchantia polymorpha TaxID=3197 RepID=A0A176VTB1_MARPO|nr:hypothetical protein AXG93_2402s1070 [Marchantia polymorpha subsp. ruderalis]PTQ39415.1 hypothetical protein MARPO_0045s0076 [Marchantia polymorpha]BBN15473.1 hypothetical protein Mp_6g19870 [Marchantia polymorpha subsp. ruderalis]|eukprot:PTQ39415.1 hypothetical protein MARPO_0045s0076 [Marchantia polymorpha]
MASSSHGGTPSASDVRRARAARFSFSPIAQFGSPSFSLGLEKLPPPPSFDECCENGVVQKVDEKQTSKRKRVLSDSSSPSFSLGLEDIPPPAFEDGERIEPSSRNKHGPGPETREAQRVSSSKGGDKALAPQTNDRNLGSNSTRRSGREHLFNQGRASRGFSAPSFSLGLEEHCSPSKPDSLQSPCDKQGLTHTRSSADYSTYPSSSLCGEATLSSASFDLQQMSIEEKAKRLKSTSHPPACDLSKFRTRPESVRQSQVRSMTEQKPLQDATSLPSPSLLEKDTVRRSNFVPLQETSPEQMQRFAGNSPAQKLIAHVKTEPTSLPSPSLIEKDSVRRSKFVPLQETLPEQMQRFAGNSPAQKLIAHVKTEPTSHFDLPCKPCDGQVHGRLFELEKSSPGFENERSTLQFESLSGSIEDQKPEHGVTKDGPSKLRLSAVGDLHPEPANERLMKNSWQSVEGHHNFEKVVKKRRLSKAVEVANAATEVNPVHFVGLIPKKEQVVENLDKCGEGVVTSSSHSFDKLGCSPPIFDGYALVDSSQERDEKPKFDHLKVKQGLTGQRECSPVTETPLEDISDKKVSVPIGSRENVVVLDVSTPPSSSGRAANRPSNSCLPVNFVEDSEEEQDFVPISKRGRRSVSRAQVKLESNFPCLADDSSLPSVDVSRIDDERTQETPVIERKKAFVRLRRGSSSAVKDCFVSENSQVDRHAVLKKVKAEPGDSCINLHNQARPSLDDSKKGMTDCSQHSNADDFDDIEDFSDDEMLCAGSRPQRNRRSLQSSVIPKNLPSSTSSPAALKKTVLRIPGLDTENRSSVVAKKLGKTKAEPINFLDSKNSFPTVVKKTGDIKAEPITLSDDDELWREKSRSRVSCSQSMQRGYGKGSTTSVQNRNLDFDIRRAVSTSNARESRSSSKGKAPVMDGSDLWKSYTGNFSPDEMEGLSDRLASASRSEDGIIADMLRERLPHFKPVEALSVNGGLDLEPVYIDYRNQFGHSQGMDSTDFAQLDCSQPQSRRKQKRSSSKGTKNRKANGSFTTSSQRTTVSKPSSKGKRKAWTLFRENTRRASTSASASASGNGYWIVENKKRVYVKDGRTLTGRSAYSAYKKDTGKKSRKTKKQSKP